MPKPVWLISSKDIGYSPRTPEVPLTEYIFGANFNILEETAKELAAYPWVEAVRLHQKR